MFRFLFYPDSAKLSQLPSANTYHSNHALPMSVSQFRDHDDEDEDLSEPTKSSSQTAKLSRNVREKLEREVQERLEAAREIWKAQQMQAAEEWKRMMELQAKTAAMGEARAKMEMEKQAEKRAKAAEEARNKAEVELREQILQEAIVKVEEELKKKEKLPIKFKDAIGRKFSFPFHLAQAWTVSFH